MLKKFRKLVIKFLLVIFQQCFIAGHPDNHYGKHWFFTKFRIWLRGKREKMKFPCAGRIAHHLCIFGIRELPLLASRHEMFANKFHWDFEPLGYRCMEELHYNRTRQELEGRRVFSSRLYRSMDYVKYHVPSCTVKAGKSRILYILCYCFIIFNFQ